MTNKKIKSQNPTADELLKSMLESVGQSSDSDQEDIGLDSDMVEDVGEFSFPQQNGGLSDDSSSNNFWQDAENHQESLARQNELSGTEIFRQLGEKAASYNGPEATDDFLDQIVLDSSKKEIIKNNPLPQNKVVGYVNNSDYGQSKSEYNSSKFIPTENLKLEGVNQATEVLSNNQDGDRTIAVPFAKKVVNDSNELSSIVENSNDDDEKILLIQKPSKVNTSQVSLDASLLQAENLRIAQNKILELEKEIERLRQENDEIITTSEILRNKTEDFTIKITQLEKSIEEKKTDHQNEMALLKGNLSYKESENQKLKTKLEEVEQRIKSDFKKIRIRERELENRLELIKAEKIALLKSKDELLLDLKRRNDQSKSEIENYREKVQELNKSLENYQTQIRLTVRALRIALSHIEENADPLKKAN